MVTFDGPNLLIIVDSGETSLDFRNDVYSDWKEWVKDSLAANASFPEAISNIGGDSLPEEGQFVGTTFFLENDWRMRSWEGNHSLTIFGNAFTRTGDPLFVNTLGAYTVQINLRTSTLPETFVLPSVQGASTIDSADLINIADEVWDEIIDSDRGQTAREKVRKIRSSTQNFALDD